MAVTSDAVPSGAVASVFGNEFNYVNLREGVAGLPQRIAILATYDPTKTTITANEPLRFFSDVDVGEALGFGFPAHLAARQTLRKSGVVPVFIFPIAETGVVAAGSILFSVTATSSGTLSLYIAGQLVRVSVPVTTTPADVATLVAAAITADVNLPVTGVVDGSTAEKVNITSKYKGLIGNDIDISINIIQQEKDNTPGGVTAVITDMSSGTTTPVLDTALNNFGDDWYTYVVNTFGTDTTAMGEFDVFNEDERWNTLINKPFRAFYGSTDSFSAITTITDARKLDRTNGVIHSPAAYCLPLELAALAVGQMAARNQNDPAQPYTGLRLDGLIPAAATSQLTYTQRDAAEKLGTGTTILEDGIIKLEDIVMHYHRTGEEPPAYRYSVDIAKLCEWLYNVALVFKSDDWRGKILVADTDIISNPNARRPLDAKAAIFKLADAFSEAAIITKPETTKANTTAGIDGSNPNRINIVTLLVLSGATRIISLTTNFGFNFGALSE